ncbi:hypothetical protein FE257_008499 [Aspergillus nanangensis]|uniref:Zn(2)-C6 fungal-type domain-containing protein n=1 Tax=Aspergillus nanangensis TaxID=2582783 RepID=A0AAD4GTC7_ASPNN|nr:hypothetical protein FE257_008499 [Aspergillus nanangensis]
MFHTFAAPMSSPVPKRKKTIRACEFCRGERVRCEDITPCPACAEKNIPCIRREKSSKKKRESRKKRGSKKEQGATELLIDTQSETDIPQDTAPPLDNHPQFESDQLQTTIAARPPVDRHHAEDRSRKVVDKSDTIPGSIGMDSMVGFISRVNAFCTGLPQVPPQTEGDVACDDSAPHLRPFPPCMMDSTGSSECSLSDAQVERLLGIFHSKLYPQMPIIRLADLKLPTNQSGEKCKSSPLRDAVTAYCMQFVYYSGLNERLIGLRWEQFSQGSHSSRVGMPYFNRCLAATTRYIAFARPSLMVLQCYCIMTLYLLDAGQHRAAHNMIGLAVRSAQSLDLHHDPHNSMKEVDADHLRRIWWTLIHLDFRCSRHFGKSMTVAAPDTTCIPPHVVTENITNPDCLYYHDQSLKLTAISLQVIQSLSDPMPEGGGRRIESRAKRLTDERYRLCEWKTSLEQQPCLRIFDVDVENIPMPDPNSIENHTYDSNEEGLKKYTPVQILLTTLLELQYHDIMITLHRVFIQFPESSFPGRLTPLSDSHGATALNHAMATAYLVHSRMAHNDSLYGCCELYQYQWNAVLTIMGFILAYPYCQRVFKARRYVDLALEIFESAGPHNVAARRFTDITRQTCTKMDTLLDILHGQESAGPGCDIDVFCVLETPGGKGPSSTSHPTLECSGVHTQLGNRNPSGMNPQQKRPQGSAYSSYTPSIDSIYWNAYCDEVNDIFNRLPDIGMYQNSLFDEYLCM